MYWGEITRHSLFILSQVFFTQQLSNSALTACALLQAAHVDELQQVLEKLGAKEFVPPGVFRVVG